MILNFQSQTSFWHIILHFNSALVTKEADFLFWWQQLTVVGSWLSTMKNYYIQIMKIWNRSEQIITV